MSQEASRVERTERLLNLVLCLMSTSRAIPRSEIQRVVPGYAEAASDAAFERMFERDKDELRGMGVPVETVADSSGEVEGYRILAEQYALPALDFTAPELAVIALAASVWDEAILGPVATTALRKIEVGEGSSVRPAAESRVSVQVSAGDAALLPLMTALRERRTVTFNYRAAATKNDSKRRVDPWGVVSREGRWYLVAHDHDRGATRVFRLSRIAGVVTISAQSQGHPVPAGTDIRALVMSAPPEDSARVQVRVASGAGAQLRRMSGDPLGPFEAGTIDVQAQTVTQLVANILAAGDAAEVVAPGAVRDLVIAGLKAVARSHGGVA
jgi:predicted DNA-binding transcriptional regulator YafY